MNSPTPAMSGLGTFHSFDDVTGFHRHCSRQRQNDEDHVPLFIALRFSGMESDGILANLTDPDSSYAE